MTDHGEAGDHISLSIHSLQGPSPEATAQLQRTGTSSEKAGAPPLGLSTVAQNPGSPSSTEGSKGPSAPRAPQPLDQSSCLTDHTAWLQGAESRCVSLRASLPAQPAAGDKPTHPTRFTGEEKRLGGWGGGATDREESQHHTPRAQTSSPGRISSDHIRLTAIRWRHTEDMSQGTKAQSCIPGTCPRRGSIEAKAGTHPGWHGRNEWTPSSGPTVRENTCASPGAPPRRKEAPRWWSGPQHTRTEPREHSVTHPGPGCARLQSRGYRAVSPDEDGDQGRAPRSLLVA